MISDVLALCQRDQMGLQDARQNLRDNGEFRGLPPSVVEDELRGNPTIPAHLGSLPS